MDQKAPTTPEEILALYEKSQREANRNAVIKYLAVVGGSTATGGLLGLLASKMHPMLDKPDTAKSLGLTGSSLGFGIGGMAGTSILNARSDDQSRASARLMKQLSSIPYKAPTQEGEK